MSVARCRRAVRCACSIAWWHGDRCCPADSVTVIQATPGVPAALARRCGVGPV